MVTIGDLPARLDWSIMGWTILLLALINLQEKKRKANGYWRGRLPPNPAVVLSIRLRGDANTAKPLTPTTFESTSLGFLSWFMFACFLPQSDTSISSFHRGISWVFRKQYWQHSSQFRMRHKKKGEAGEMLVRASAPSPSLVPFLPYVLWLLFPFLFLSKPAPTSCKPNSLLMPTIKIMNCDGRTPSNEGTSGVLSPLSHTAGDFRALHSS